MARSNEVDIGKTKEQFGDGGFTGATVGFQAQLWQMADALRDTLLPKLLSGAI